MNKEFKIQFEEIIKENCQENLYDELFRMKIENGQKTIERRKVINVVKANNIVLNNKRYEKLKHLFFEDDDIKNLEDAGELLTEFIKTYFYKTKKFEFVEEKFEHVSDILKFRIEKKIMGKIFYFTPLYNFDTALEFSVGEYFDVVKISSNELNKILNLGRNNCGMNYWQEKLKYVLKFSVDKTEENAIINPELTSQSFLDAVRIAKNGAVSFGSFYQFHPDEWQAILRPGEAEPIHGGTSTEISESDIGLIREITSELEKFQNSLKCPNHSEVEKECKSCSTEFAKGRYLKYAIRRFHYIHRETEVEDQITDLMISLEAMLNREKYEVTDKTSQRAGFILEKEDREKLECTKFIKNCYGIRSEIVHAKKRDEKLRKDVKQNDIILTDEQIKEKLEMYVRNAIQKILKLQNSYGSQQEILQKIDEASIDRSKSI